MIFPHGAPIAHDSAAATFRHRFPPASRGITNRSRFGYRLPILADSFSYLVKCSHRMSGEFPRTCNAWAPLPFLRRPLFKSAPSRLSGRRLTASGNLPEPVGLHPSNRRTSSRQTHRVPLIVAKVDRLTREVSKADVNAGLKQPRQEGDRPPGGSCCNRWRASRSRKPA
jgi:hypothetical protein